jgi:hypothetical protein
MPGRVVWFAVVCGACSDGGGEATGTTGLDLSNCESSDAPEVFLGRGVGGAFELLEDNEALGLTAAPQGGFGVSVLVGTRGLQAGPDEIVSAELTAESPSVKNSGATFALDAVLDCKSDGPDGPQGIIYGVVVGFASSLSNTNLLTMNGQPAILTVSVTDAIGNVGSVEHTVTLIVGE